MNIQIRHYEEKDFGTIQQWAEHREVMIFKEMLPKLGFIAFDEDTGDDLACVWLYMDNSVGVGFPHWLLANPNNNMEASRNAIRILGERMEYAAEDLGYGAFVTFFEEGAMTREAGKNGWSVIGEGQTMMMKLLRK